MADELSKNAGPVDVEAVSALVKLMKEFDVSEIDLQGGGQRIRLRRGQRLMSAPQTMVMSPPSAGLMPQAAMPGPVPATPVATASARGLVEIKSELVGSFYAKPAPDKDDYVKVGSRVSPDTVVCKVEAMKIFNDITAKCSGTIVEICVQNGQFVEFEQVLFRVDPS